MSEANGKLVRASELTSPLLVKLDEGRRALAEARTIHEKKKIRDFAKSTADLLKQQKFSLEAVQYAIELKLSAEIALGESLTENVRPGRPGKMSCDTTFLPDEISRDQSSKFQKLARVKDLLPEYLALSRAEGNEPSTIGLLRHAAKVWRPDPVGLVDPPQGKYRTIVIDPPWDTERIQRDEHRQSLHLPYPTMTVEEIAALPVPELADEAGCHLYFWYVHSMRDEAMRILRGWGFHDELPIVWCKPNGMPIPGSWKYATEDAMFARKGNLRTVKQGQMNWFRAKQSGHSRKPDKFYAVVRKVSPGPRLDMFARERRKGFEAWGNEVPATS